MIVKKDSVEAVDPNLLAHFPGHLTFHKLPVSQRYCRELENLIVLGQAFPLALRRSPGRTGEISGLQLTLLWLGAAPLSEHELSPCSLTALPKRHYCLETIRDFLNFFLFFPSLPDNFSRHTCSHPPTILKNFAYS